MTTFTLCVVGPERPFVFTELAQLLYYSLNSIGYSVEITYNRIRHQTVNIIVGAHMMATESDMWLPENTIILNTEQLQSLHNCDDKRRMYAERIIHLAKRFTLWDYSHENLHYLSHFEAKNTQYLQLGWQPELLTISAERQRDVDVLFYGSVNERRYKILEQLSQYGLKVKTLFDVWGLERDEWIARSRIVLNMHYYDSEIFEIIRCFYLMNNAVAVVSEENAHALINPIYRDGVVAAPYEQLAYACSLLCRNDALLNKQRQLALDTIKQYPQVDILQRLLK